MIEAFFELHGLPFGRSVPVVELLRTDSWDELHARMLHTAGIRGFGGLRWSPSFGHETSRSNKDLMKDGAGFQDAFLSAPSGSFRSLT